MKYWIRWENKNFDDMSTLKEKDQLRKKKETKPKKKVRKQKSQVARISLFPLQVCL